MTCTLKGWADWNSKCLDVPFLDNRYACVIITIITILIIIINTMLYHPSQCSLSATDFNDTCKLLIQCIEI